MSAQLTILALGSYAPGTYTLDPVSIPPGVSSVHCAIDLTLMTTLTASMSWRYELSFDAGATWKDVGGAGLDLSQSGYTVNVLNQYVNTQGQMMTETSSDIYVADAANTNRKIRGTFTVSESVQTKILLTMV